MGDREVNLEELLNQLHSDEARFSFMRKYSYSKKLETLGIKKPEHRCDAEGDFCESENEYEVKEWTYVAKVTEKVGLKEIAIGLYEKAGNHASRLSLRMSDPWDKFNYRPWQYKDAARIAQEIGMTKKAHQLYVKLVEYYEKNGEYRAAAEIAQLGGMRRRANKLYRRAIKKILKGPYTREEREKAENEALKVAEETGMTKEACQLRARLIDREEKRRRLEDTANREVVENCEKRGDYENAIKFANKVGMTSRINLYRCIEELLK